MGRVVLDTSVWIHIERTRTSKGLIEQGDELIMAAAALAELRVAQNSASRSKSAREETKRVIESFMIDSSFAPIDDRTTAIFAELKAFTQTQGRPMGVNDLWIAASAIQYKAELATLDKSAYFEGLPGLQVRC